MTLIISQDSIKRPGPSQFKSLVRHLKGRDALISTLIRSLGSGAEHRLAEREKGGERGEGRGKKGGKRKEARGGLR